ncbi:hypothetical protein MferCBS49748_006284 [Microsporum ferrugineum]
MRPPQLILLLICLVFIPLFITTLIRQSAGPEHAAPEYRSYTGKVGRLRDLFFHAPSSLFPPSALISLTDDNSTFFLARPAAFGPPLPSSGLDGQLWVGSGFGDNVGKKGGITTKAEGELGCSDVPGWEEGDRRVQAAAGGRHGADKVTSQDHPGIIVGEDGKLDIQKGVSTVLPQDDGKKSGLPTKNDGTDDHLHHSLGDSIQPSLNDASGKNKQPTHADIQSLQESAEISGKVVLLSRGGCGFLEKTKWVQRRGGIALIVGDNESGGGLVTMYAHGDTSNVTIPAVFTSHTTAHLLSSLIPTDKGQGHGSPGNKPKASIDGKQNKKTSSSASKASIVAPSSKSAKATSSKPKNTPSSDKGFFSSLFNLWNDKSVHEDSRRPPSSGNIDWTSQGGKSDSVAASKPRQDSAHQDKDKGTAAVQAKPDPHQNSEDDFLIGVQDWRDPDLVAKPTTTTTGKPQPTSQNGNPNKDGSGPDAKGFKGGSITPGSGEYTHQGKGNLNGSNKQSSTLKSGSGNSAKKVHWWTGLFGGGKTTDEKNSGLSSGSKDTQNGGGPHNKHGHHDDKGPEKHEGLWVTLAPTSMSTSPFFDTLLVLVVSPLITLTVVYALLLLRSRIRRRRWRAPKAIVDRLPVRTYHTITSSSNSSTPPRTAVPDSASPSSPLLARSESRARFSTHVDATASNSLPNMTDIGTEKSNAGSTLWRRKYTGRQVECVVCLEEYVDGQSKVMSLPCGHEFHAECITPWLTTRRRTCPICKGDVVRSFGNHGSNDYDSSSPDPSSSFDQARALEDHSGFPSSAIPIPDHENTESELERGALLGDALNASNRSTWRGLTSLSLSALSGDSMWQQVRHTRSQRNR